ncbi:Elongin-A [Coemansia furcata]|uniref:Elongin-A n=1 Tax=Coemansia furcata TaxID=417177 RepID=A0ACC1KW28_9FUNG|nr:Elongin-A [Coemansia furcata]
MDSSAREVPSLKELCQRALKANIERIRYLGVTPQFLVADALAQCTAEQLDTLEHYNPHIVEDNEGLWKSHCLRKHRDQAAGLEGVRSWRALYWELRRRDEERAREILQRVRVKSAAVERSVRKIQVSRVPAREVVGRSGGRGKAKEVSLVQRVKMDTIAHMEMMGGWRRSGARRQDAVASGSSAGSPAGSPPYSPPRSYSPPQSQSYSPPYFSSASSCSPPHSSYSPPYVPELSGGERSPEFDVFEDMFGVSGGALTKTLPETVVIREQTMLRRKPESSAKRKRSDAGMADRAAACRQGEKRSRRIDTGSQADATVADRSSEEGAASHAEDRPEDTARRRVDDIASNR